MKKPMANKTEELKQAIEAVFPGTDNALENNQCPVCKQTIIGFKDELSEKEYEISGLCQDCQDNVFGEPEDEFREPE